MDLRILDKKVQDYIQENLKNSVTKLAFAKNRFPEMEFKEILNQIECKQKAEIKLPTWFATLGIYYPNKTSLEQTSSEITANYKSQIVTGKTLLDASGGFGVDDFYFAKKFKHVVHCEIQTNLSQIVATNFKQLKVSNISCYCGDSSDYLKSENKKNDVIYIDPARRNKENKKVFFLEDCEPNIPLLQNFYHQFADVLLVKTSPLLDISSALKSITNVSEIHVVAVQNEVKELLFKIEKDFEGDVIIKTINFGKDTVQTLDFDKNVVFDKPYSFPKKYLFEPNNAILKSGKFEEIVAFFDLEKLHSHSHLYTSDSVFEFPGRVFEIDQILPYSKKEMLKISNQKANITVRNFPETVENLRKKWKIKDGGTSYYFFTTNKENAKIVLLCNKLK